MDSHDAEATLDSSQKARRRSQIAAVAVLTAAILGVAGYYLVDNHRRKLAIASAQSALAGDDFVQARSQLEQGVRSWPNDGELQLLLAQTCRRAPEQDFGAARRHLQRVSEPSLKARADLEGVLLDIQQNGLPKSREEEARMLVAANPADERLILEAVVRGCLNNARRWAAHHWLSQWISRFPGDCRAYRWRGALLQVMGEQPHLAAADYAKVLELNPDDHAVRLRLGFMLLSFGYNFDEALAHFAAQRERHPEDLNALVGIARCYREQTRLKEAVPLLDQVLRARPDDPGALLTQALIYSDLEDDERALQLLKKLEPQVERRDEAASIIAVQRGELPPPYTIGIRQAATMYHQAARVLRRLGKVDEAHGYEAKLERLAAEQSGSTTERQ